MFCAGDGGEWVPELFRAVVFDVWGRGGEGQGVRVAVSERGGEDEEEGEYDEEEGIVSGDVDVL